jgi:hypothetical protein
MSVAERVPMELSRADLVAGDAAPTTGVGACRALVEAAEREGHIVVASPGTLRRWDLWVSQLGLLAHPFDPDPRRPLPTATASGATAVLAFARLVASDADPSTDAATDDEHQDLAYPSVDQYLKATVAGTAPRGRAPVRGPPPARAPHEPHQIVAWLDRTPLLWGTTTGDGPLALQPRSPLALWTRLSALLDPR